MHTLILYAFAPLLRSCKNLSRYKHTDISIQVLFLTLFILVKCIILPQGKHKEEWLMLKTIHNSTLKTRNWMETGEILWKDQNANYWGLNTFIIHLKSWEWVGESSREITLFMTKLKMNYCNIPSVMSNCLIDYL